MKLRRHHHNSRLSFEKLEDRRILAVDLLAGNILHIQGTSADDTIVVGEESGDLTAKINGEVTTFDTAQVDSVQIDGFDGNDVIKIRKDLVIDSEIRGGGGDDVISGAAGIDLIHAGAGNDLVYGNDGADQIFGDDGDDVIRSGAGNDVVHGGLGQDRLVGEDGDDQLLGEAGVDEIRGSSGNDVVRGGINNDILIGNEGDDEVYGDEGNDELHGKIGNDLLEGGDGNDRIFGEEGDDVVHAGAGNDIARGGPGQDTIAGEDGDDRIAGEDGHDNLSGGGGNDALRGNLGNDTIVGDDGDDTLIGNEGDDQLFGGLGKDELHGKSGNDVLEGGDGNDRLLGNEGTDVLHGGGGADWLRGGADDDRLDGQGGKDNLSGEDGTDILIGQDADNDRLDAGDGTDQLQWVGANDHWAFPGLSLAVNELNPDQTQEVEVGAFSSTATTVVLSLEVLDPDVSDEGELFVNGNGPIALFGPTASGSLDNQVQTIVFSTPVSWWTEGTNSLRFTRVKTAGYEVRGITLDFTDGTPIPDPQPDPNPDPIPIPDPGAGYPDTPAAVTGYYPDPIQVITLTPQTIGQLKTLAPSAQPGTHFVLKSGRYDVERLVVQNITGTAANPIVIRSEVRGGALFMPSDWTGGAHGSVLDLRGHHFVVDGIHMSSEARYETDPNSLNYRTARFADGHYRLEAGRLLNLSSSPNTGVNHHVSIINSFFTNSWRHAIVAQGNDLTFANNVLHDNLNFNFEHTRGTWPAVLNTWWYYGENGQPSTVNLRPKFIGNQVYHNHGEGIHPAYTDGAVVAGNYVADNMFVNIGMNNSRNGVVENNYITTVDPNWTQFKRGSRGVKLWMEVTGDSPWVTIENVVVRNNTIVNNDFFYDGKTRPGIADGIQLVQQALKLSKDIPEHTFINVRIEDNVVTGGVPNPYEIQCVPSKGDMPSGNLIDMALNDPDLSICQADIGGWTSIP